MMFHLFSKNLLKTNKTIISLALTQSRNISSLTSWSKLSTLTKSIDERKYFSILKPSPPLKRYLLLPTLQNQQFSIRTEHFYIKKYSTNTRESTTDKYPQQQQSSSSSPLKFDQLINQLRNDINKAKRINIHAFSNAIELAKNQSSLSETDGLFLMYCCSMIPDKPKPEKLALIEQIWEILGESLKRANNDISKEAVVQLIRAYTVNGKKLIYSNFLKEYEDFTDDITIYEELLHLAAENGDSDGIVNILSEIKRNEFPITEHVFNGLIIGHSRARNLEHCESIVEVMQQDAQLTPSPKTWLELIRAYVENGTASKAEHLLREYGAQFSESQIITIIRSAVRRHDQDKVLIASFKLLSNDTLWNVHIAPDLRNICIELIHANEAQKAYKIIEYLPVPKFNENQDSDGYASFFINELIRSGNLASDVIAIAQKLFETGRNQRAIHVCCEFALKSNSLNSLEYLKELSRIEQLRPHYFWPLFIQSYEQQGEIGILNILSEMQDLDVEFDYETLSTHVLPKLVNTLKDIKLGIRILNDHGCKMSELITPLISQLIYKNRLVEANEVIATYPTRLNTQQLIWPLMVNVKNIYYSNSPAEDFKVISRLLKTISSKQYTSQDYDLVGQLLMEIILNSSKRISYKNVLEFLLQLQEADIRISKITGEILQQYVSKSPNPELKLKVDDVLAVICDNKKKSFATPTKFKPSGDNLMHSENNDDDHYGSGNKNSEENTGLFEERSHILHPRDMNLSELECHLVELQTKQLNVRGVLRRLFQLNVREGKYSRALEIKKLCEDNQVSFSPGMTASLLELLIRTGNVNDAEKCIQQLWKSFPTFQLDEHKVLDLANLFIKNGQFKRAKDLLLKRASCEGGVVRGGVGIQKNIWQLLSSVATRSASDANSLDSNSSSPTTANQSKEFLQYLAHLGYCDNTNNALLGPIIREHLLKGEIREAVTEFLEISQKYKRTPLQYELLTVLIKISNGQPLNDDEPKSFNSNNDINIDSAEAKTFMEQVMEANSRVHGALNANCSLVVAFAQSGTERQLRKIMIDPAIRINMEAILKQCEFLCNSGTIEPLLKLAKCSRGLSGSVREQDFYNLILSHYSRENDYAAAMNLFDRIIGDDEYKLPTDFINQLINLLEKNNVEIPANVKMFAKS